MEEPTLEELKRIVTFGRNGDGELFVERVDGYVRTVGGNVWSVEGDVWTVNGHVKHVEGNVWSVGGDVKYVLNRKP